MMNAENPTVINLTKPAIDREYVEIYPINWESVDNQMVKDIFTSRSKEGLKEMSLYFHIPFCQTLCPFCKFNIVEYDNSTYKEYIKTIRAEIDYYQGHPDIEGRKVSAVYFGGGTGSMVKPEDLATILDDINRNFSLDSKAEITVESHPNTVTEKRFQEYQRAGVNRVSIGIQSFQDENLQAIGRNHTAERNTRVLSAAKNSGFESVAIDLMYRLPNQSVENLLIDLEQVKKFHPEGISVYSLGIEDTVMRDKVSELADDAGDKEFFYLIRNLLENNGYMPFMQPDYSLPGKECKYVVNAWRAPQQLMLSFGAGAHTHYFGGHNWANVYPIKDYMNTIRNGQSAIAVGAKVAEQELMAKYMVLGVRAISVDKKQFKDLFGLEIQDVFSQQLTELARLGWLTDHGNDYRITREGLYYTDNISKFFYSRDNTGQNQPRGRHLYNYVPKNFFGKQG